MIYQAQVIKLNDDIEEEVVLQINDARLTCFASICPYPIREGKTYPVQLELFMIDDFEVIESSEYPSPTFIETGEGYTYLIQGRLDGKYLHAGSLIFEDEFFQMEFGYLDGKFVTIKADRINVEFLL